MQAFTYALQLTARRGYVVIGLKPEARALAKGDLLNEFAGGYLPPGHMLRVAAPTVRRDWEAQLDVLKLPDRERERGEKFYRCKLVKAIPTVGKSKWHNRHSAQLE